MGNVNSEDEFSERGRTHGPSSRTRGEGGSHFHRSGARSVPLLPIFLRAGPKNCIFVDGGPDWERISPSTSSAATPAPAPAPRARRRIYYVERHPDRKGGGAALAPQVRGCSRQRPFGGVGGPQDLDGAHDLARVARHVREDLELRRRQRDLGVVAHHLTAVAVPHEVPHFDRRFAVLCWGRDDAPARERANLGAE